MTTYYTDYPFTELGDISHQEAPIRKIKINSYDGNKYASVTVLDEAQVFSIKIGYIYLKEGRCGDVPSLNHEQACKFIRYW